MTTDSTFATHRVDDIPLLIAVIKHMGLERILAELVPTHGNTRYHCLLSTGAALCIWLVYLISQGDHRKWKMEEWVALHTAVLSKLWGEPVVPGDFSDDRLSTLAAYVGRAEILAAIDQAVGEQILSLVELDHLRLDATVFTGYHAPTAGGLMQYGQRKGGPAGCTQYKLMAAATGAGQYVAGQFSPGHRADDPLYVPLLDQLFTQCQSPGMLFVGDCKMGSLATRRHIATHGHYYYLPVSQPALSSETREQLVEAAVAGQLSGLAPIVREEQLLGYGYEMSREVSCAGTVWTERMHIIRALSQVEAERKTLERRMATACAGLRALPPPPKQGVKAYTDAAVLAQKIAALLDPEDLHGLVEYTLTVEPYTTKKGPKKSPKKGAKKGTETEMAVRYVVRDVHVNAEVVRERLHRAGWRVFVTTAPPERLSLEAGQVLYRQGAGQGIERMNEILKAHDTLGFHSLYVRTDEQLRGLGALMTLALRIIMHIEITIRINLAQEKRPLSDYYPQGRTSTKPTTKTMLERITFRGVTLLETWDRAGHRHWQLSPLPVILVEMLQHLHLEPTVYTQLIE